MGVELMQKIVKDQFRVPASFGRSAHSTGKLYLHSDQALFVNATEPDSVGSRARPKGVAAAQVAFNRLLDGPDCAIDCIAVHVRSGGLCRAGLFFHERFPAALPTGAARPLFSLIQYGVDT